MTLNTLITQVRYLLNEPASIPVAGRFYTDDEITEWINDSIDELCEETDINYQALEYTLTNGTLDYNINLWNAGNEILYLNELNYHDNAWETYDYRELYKTTRREIYQVKNSTNTELKVCSIFNNILHLAHDPTTSDKIELTGRWKTASISGYKLVSIIINSGGTGYQDGEAVTIASSSSTKSATGTIAVTGGAITAVTITDGGIGFGSTTDTLTITGDTSAANDATVTSYTASSVDFPLTISARNAVKKYATAIGFLKKGKAIGEKWLSLYGADKKKISVYTKRLLSDNLVKGLTVNKHSDVSSFDGRITT